MNKSFDSLANTTAIQDALFGPGFRGQQQQFDFTLLFESIVLSILPAAAFLIYMPRRAWWLWGEQMKASWSHLVVGKQAGVESSFQNSSDIPRFCIFSFS